MTSNLMVPAAAGGMPAPSRRAILLGGGSLVIAAAGAAGPAMATAPTPIEDLFSRFLVVRDMEAPNDDEFAPIYQEYVALQERITAAEPATARELAIQIFVETDGGDSEWRPEFFRRVEALARGGRA